MNFGEHVAISPHRHDVKKNPFLNWNMPIYEIHSGLSLLDIEILLLHGITIFGAVISRQVWRYGSLYSYFAVFRDFDVISFGGQTLCQNMGIFADGL